MDNILIFKTASDSVLDKLLEELSSKKQRKYCIIQSSLINIYSQKYKDIQFIDIQKEGFYDISRDVLKVIKNISFTEVYIPTTGPRAMNFGNILEIVEQLNYRKIIFYSCNGGKNIINKKSKLEEKMIRLYIYLIHLIYRQGN